MEKHSFRLPEAKSELRRKSKRLPMTALLKATERCLLNATAFQGLKRLALKRMRWTSCPAISPVSGSSAPWLRRSMAEKG